MSWFDEQARAVARRLGPGTPLEPGETWLLSVDRAGALESAALWRLQPQAPHEEGQAAFTRHAARSLERASALARLEVPLLASPGSLGNRVEWRALNVIDPQGVGARQLDGGSFGLAMVLAATSRLIGLSMSATLVASACVGDGGRIEEVKGLDAKLSLLGHSELGQRELTCLVARSQEEEAKSHAPGHVRVVGVEHLSEAINEAFDKDELAGHLRGRWSSRDEREAAARTFFRLAVEGSNLLLGWHALARGATMLGEMSADDPWAWRVGVAARIAWRHANVPEALVVEPEHLAELPRPRRVQLIAHAVQAAADSVSPDWSDTLERATAFVPDPGEEYPVDLKLLGAMGRTQAAWGRYEEARDVLARAVRGWLALDDEPQSSYALSELLRVLGILGEPLDDVASAGIARFQRDPRPDATSRAFLRAAHGRALVQLGRPQDAATVLQTTTRWENSPVHLQATRLR